MLYPVLSRPHSPLHYALPTTPPHHSPLHYVLPTTPPHHSPLFYSQLPLLHHSPLHYMLPTTSPTPLSTPLHVAYYPTTSLSTLLRVAYYPTAPLSTLLLSTTPPTPLSTPLHVAYYPSYTTLRSTTCCLLPHRTTLHSSTLNYPSYTTLHSTTCCLLPLLHHSPLHYMLPTTPPTPLSTPLRVAYYPTAPLSTPLRVAYYPSYTILRSTTCCLLPHRTTLHSSTLNYPSYTTLRSTTCCLLPLLHHSPLHYVLPTTPPHHSPLHYVLPTTPHTPLSAPLRVAYYPTAPLSAPLRVAYYPTAPLSTPLRVAYYHTAPLSTPLLSTTILHAVYPPPHKFYVLTLLIAHHSTFTHTVEVNISPPCLLTPAPMHHSSTSQLLYTIQWSASIFPVVVNSAFSPAVKIPMLWHSHPIPTACIPLRHSAYNLSILPTSSLQTLHLPYLLPVNNLLFPHRFTSRLFQTLHNYLQTSPLCSCAFVLHALYFPTQNTLHFHTLRRCRQ